MSHPIWFVPATYGSQFHGWSGSDIRQNHPTLPPFRVVGGFFFDWNDAVSQQFTPQKFNIFAPEKWWLEDKPFLLGWWFFRGYVKLPGGNFTFGCCKWGLFKQKYQEQVFGGSRKTHTLFLLSQWFGTRPERIFHFHWHMSRFVGVVSLLPKKWFTSLWFSWPKNVHLMKPWLVNSPIEWVFITYKLLS